ncbi:MAG: GNAT family N-acetyltransferase [Bacteroidales bacterium]|nr:GNAT family N-acetyltransferase [Bacteroidales bacterium]MDD3990466.1 GNAT family N-acetyltransferase [Bacteroidales bacterium]
MQQNIGNNDVVLDKKSMRFLLTLDNHTGYVEYRVHETYLDLYHTYVPEGIEGRGVAASMVRAALKFAKENNLKIKPTCPYVKRFIERESALYSDLLLPD